jgi:alkanesulfonate monooxygenase SsuD/methylene tetrahydromethanopterin reductase-like flavin-dependent oxidoreductase (luciferase family)
MRLSVSLRSGYPVADDPRRGVRWMVERTRAAREAGLDALFVGDGHVTAPTPYFQGTPILGRLLAEWGDAPAGAFFVLPLWHPVLVAEQVATLAAIARGRFILQCGVGGAGAASDGLGVPPTERRPRFEAGLDIVRRLLAGETVTSNWPYRVTAARIAPVPVQPVEVWVAGHARPAIDRAARLGDGWLTGPAATDGQAAELVAKYRERCAAHQRTPSAVAIRRDVHVGADDGDAHRVADPILDRGYRGFDPAACVVGGPRQVAERLAGYADLGYSEVVVRHLADDQGDVLASTGRLAEVRAAIRS